MNPAPAMDGLSALDARKATGAPRRPARRSEPGQPDGAVADMFQATEGRWGSGPVRIERVTIERGGEAAHVFRTGDRLAVRLGFHTAEPVRDFVFGIGIFNADGTCCYGTNTDVEGFEPVELSGSGEVVFAIDSLDLVEGTYKLDVAAHTRGAACSTTITGSCTRSGSSPTRRTPASTARATSGPSARTPASGRRRRPPAAVPDTCRRSPDR